MSPEEIKISLSRQDIAALRKADDLVFTHRDGASYIRAIKRVTDKDKQRDPWADDKEHRINADVEFRDYKNEFLHGNWSAFEMFNGAQYSRQWQTIAGFLRPLDQLTLMWTANNNSQILDEANLHNDMLRVHVKRITKSNKTKNFVFLVDVRTSKNNTARMIRHGR